ncbi:MAG: ribosome silencing factor [Oscillospiraceae bacterium]|nr:ribosome silencing factor [Oscillospiraceae bacterium]
MTPKEIALTLAKIADAKKAEDIRVMDVVDLTVLADYFVICTGTSAVHLRTLAEEMERELKERGVLPHHIEGQRSGNWLLMDYAGVVVHLFLRDTRDFYALERLWSDAATVAYAPDELPAPEA